MSNELNTAISPGLTIYALIYNAAGKIWDVTNEAFVAYETANRDDYDVAMTEQGTASGVYYADFPTAITASGSYEFLCYIQGGGTPVEPTTDQLAATGIVDWTGSSEVSAGAGSMTATAWLAYFLRGGYKRTDKDTEVYESTTDAIQELRRRFSFDEAQADTTTTDTIAVLGDFKLDIESDLGLVLDMVIQDGTQANVLTLIPKALFDQKFPDINVTTDRGYPKYASIYNGQIYLGAIPDLISYTYRINYSKRAGTVTSNTAAVPFTDLYRDALRDLVNHYLYEIEEEYEKSAYYRNKFESKYIDMVRRERHNQKSYIWAVQPTNV